MEKKNKKPIKTTTKFIIEIKLVVIRLKFEVTEEV